MKQKRTEQEIRELKALFEQKARELTGDASLLAAALAREAEARLKPKAPPKYHELLSLLESNNQAIPLDLKKCIPDIHYYFQQAGHSFNDFSTAMIQAMGEDVKPFLKDWYLGIKHYNNQKAIGQLTIKPEK